MEKANAEQDQIKVEIIIRDGCNFSYETLKSLLLSRDQFPDMTLNVVDIAESADNRQTIGGITPSIWVNNKLWFLGSFSAETFHSRLSSMSSATHLN
ncbi:MAG: hypothetical protein HOD43_13845 [Candidatus Marinimicrobia bacterium]|jgi:hypothetical protein|nr:hypothetical protein [Candidatus Neomarinimicrobiota bacterium]MBT3631157.1 hypothetical protein [Candidatus Neomarinimicrobiota bacterium]MBT3825055.1 hypothetical protein [Candidatus Neomarinimicrobiota bacterium]MBT4131398.1 hypothetical protein [Candidatus Neomarinimicrobiota bacterium]MBT4296877.1 hypothetical protein [Candidatus Neomarinimicrobiota bacterium]